MRGGGRMLEDAARAGAGAMALAAALRREARDLVPRRPGRMLSDRDPVARDAFETVKEMAAKARAGQARLAALDAAGSAPARWGLHTKVAIPLRSRPSRRHERAVTDGEQAEAAARATRRAAGADLDRVAAKAGPCQAAPAIVVADAAAASGPPEQP